MELTEACRLSGVLWFVQELTPKPEFPFSASETLGMRGKKRRGGGLEEDNPAIPYPRAQRSKAVFKGAGPPFAGPELKPPWKSVPSLYRVSLVLVREERWVTFGEKRNRSRGDQCQRRAWDSPQCSRSPARVEQGRVAGVSQ